MLAVIELNIVIDGTQAPRAAPFGDRIAIQQSRYGLAPGKDGSIERVKSTMLYFFKHGHG